MKFKISGTKKYHCNVNIDKRPDDYISCIIAKSIKDGSHMMISKLKSFTKSTCNRHFKIAFTKKVEAFIVSNDLKYAFNQIPLLWLPIIIEGT